MRKHRWRFFLLLIVCSLAVWGVATPAHADFGPKLIEMIRVDVTVDGQPISDRATAVLMTTVEEGAAGPSNAAKSIATLKVPHVDEEGREWEYAEYLWGGQFRDGTVTFKGFYLSRTGMPSIVRLAIFDPTTNNLWITNPLEPGEYLCLMKAEVTDDNSATLQVLSIPLWRRMDFWKALLITILVECLIVGWVRKRKSSTSPDEEVTTQPSLAKLMQICLVVNVLTLPLIWFFGGHFLFELGRTAGIATFLGLEVAAFLIEGIIYLGYGKLRARDAYLASLLANTVSFGLGFVL